MLYLMSSKVWDKVKLLCFCPTLRYVGEQLMILLIFLSHLNAKLLNCYQGWKKCLIVQFKKKKSTSCWSTPRPSVPAIVFDHVRKFNDVLPLLILLTQLKRLFLLRDRVKSEVKLFTCLKNRAAHTMWAQDSKHVYMYSWSTNNCRKTIISFKYLKACSCRKVEMMYFLKSSSS